MEILKKWVMRLVGKKVIEAVGGEEKWELSKTKMTAIVAVIILAIEKLGPAFGHPIVIPQTVYDFLAAVGLWSLKDGQKA
jgi:hypothetical protein